ncbi:BCD family MFS transporter [Rhodoferax antarcticus]|uniref:Major Facilitator Superfamily protein n=1 Tax=Rhodoferax antarcticus ANT.BR TaxID=1111071 RepID=A0A1Q8YDN9_9BURK|nr:BCD family MFS transporter [Rhodoferax antarcticus]APW46027.1 MFS transporter [Rhodoferax antarcticus]MCW2310411.1 BCD family chlorophyll transporter-like MFS transporter [Rhodoferax antarcticus]OLP06166.1 major Facilitator Superfamily protein [Rhodoferax antarcticus ANT.BR]
MSSARVFGWVDIARLGLVQACMGAVVVVTTSTLNRIMVIELALPALLPGLLVALHYMVQMVRPRMGFGADQGRRCTPWMLGGVVVLAMGGLLAAVATVLMQTEFVPGLLLCILAFSLIGLGVSACGTSLLVLMAKRVPDGRRAPAATLVWMMMILGFAVTAMTVGKLIDPYTPEQLIRVTAGLSVLVICVAALSLWGLEGRDSRGSEVNVAGDAARARSPGKFKETLLQVWREPQARTFTIFVFLSMLAYSAQDLILEPFAGDVFGMSPGQTTQLAGLQHGAVLIGMLWVALVGWDRVKGRLGSVQSWMVWGCLLSAVAMVGLSTAGIQGQNWPLKANIVLLGVANGTFSIAAIATMMRLSTQGAQGHEGTRMGLWGASQAIAFGLGGILGTGASDIAHWAMASSGLAYASVFGFEALMFALSAWCAILVNRKGDVAAQPKVYFSTELQRAQS